MFALDICVVVVVFLKKYTVKILGTKKKKKRRNFPLLRILNSLLLLLSIGELKFETFEKYFNNINKYTHTHKNPFYGSRYAYM